MPFWVIVHIPESCSIGGNVGDIRILQQPVVLYQVVQIFGTVVKIVRLHAFRNHERNRPVRYIDFAGSVGHIILSRIRFDPAYPRWYRICLQFFLVWHWFNISGPGLIQKRNFASRVSSRLEPLLLFLYTAVYRKSGCLIHNCRSGCLEMSVTKVF